ncbi:TetR/AcrR family transcriptional regulator [Sphingomonas glaciei]|uniref:TetR family transcriptional regulator n=1 Tax=Sphingomonas glaciei TaxID=2938948 RepID=A0ABY5MVF0_9SPHN|nr:TetR/AcrR family transcriptional regulator [Sphingomonas glaciei]UUR07083.1 TetR family transcriptional regulator [Sphingomonas glaciei]
MPPITRNAAATRDRLLDCARKCFVQESYDAVSLREIAGAAGVDVALIGRYFGSKEQLFQAALATDDNRWEELAQADDLPTYLASMVATDDSKDAEHIERLLIMLRSATSPTASIIVRSTFKNEVLAPFADVLTGPQAERRAAMALAVLMGTTIVRTILRVDHGGGCEDVAFTRKLSGMLRIALSPDVAASEGVAELALQR